MDSRATCETTRLDFSHFAVALTKATLHYQQNMGWVTTRISVPARRRWLVVSTY
jgi:hypothetical protein